ncbi:MAG: serine protease, partial [Verrucomicrobiales bacterium]|nr:serine protease [Verrucomicrobiales bacterium]
MRSSRLVLVVAVLVAVDGALGSAFSQAEGVEIIEQSAAGRSEEDDKISAKIAELDDRGKLVGHEELLAQIKEPVAQKLVLAVPSEKRLTSAEIVAGARAGVVQVGWTYLCERCNNWHLKLSGGYPISADGAVATCAHVLEVPPMKKGSLVVVDDEGNVYPVVSVLAHDEVMDAAIVKIDHELEPFALSDQVSPGDDAFCYSDPLGQRGYFSRGMVNRFTWGKRKRGGDDTGLRALRHLRLDVSTAWAPGSSGSPVFDGFGNVIGHVAVISSLGKG